MTKELKAKWLEELRSGRFEQGRKRLKFDNKYCCIGVLCEVAGIESCVLPDIESLVTIIRGAVMYDPNEEEYTDTKYDGTGLPKPGTLKKLGLSSIDASILAALNDEEGESFAAIADYIEREIM